LTSPPRTIAGNSPWARVVGSGRTGGDLHRGGSRFFAMPSQRAPRAVTAKSGREDVPGCVQVGVVTMPAVSAFEARLRTPRLRVDHATTGTALTCIGGWDLHEISARAGELVLELPPELAPALGEYRPIQRGLSSYTRTWHCAGTPCSAGHVGYTESLDHDRAVALGEIVRESVEEVLADAGFSAPEPRNLIQRSLVTRGAPTPPSWSAPSRYFLTPGLTGQPPKAFSLFRRKARAPVKLTAGGRYRGRDATIDTERWSWARGRIGNIALTTERHVPPERITGDGQVLDLTLWIARPAKSDPAQLRDSDFTPSARRSPHADFTDSSPTLDSKTVVSALSTKPRVTRLASKESNERAVEITERLLQHVRVRCPKPGERGLGFRQLRASLRLVAKGDVIHRPGDVALFERGIPDSAGATSPLPERPRLCVGGIHAVAKAGALEHEHMFAAASDSVKVVQFR
jgi:hypothetical protein